MEIAQAQKDVRTVYIGGFAGQLVSGALWFAAAAVSTWYSLRAAAFVIFLGGFLIFPLTISLLRLLGRPAGLPKGHPMNALAIQVAFTVPLALPLVLTAFGSRESWLFPAWMIIVGAHYLPFIFLYGMWQFGLLAALLIGSGAYLGLYAAGPASLGGWLTAGLLLLFALIGRHAVLIESAEVSSSN